MIEKTCKTTTSALRSVTNCSVGDMSVASPPLVPVSLFLCVSQQRRCGLAWTCRKHQHRGDEKSVRDQLLWRGPHDQRSDARHEEEAFRAHRGHEQCHGSSGYDVCVIHATHENHV